MKKVLPQILFITTFPPRECGIATYSQDLVKALNKTFSHSFQVTICPLESHHEKHKYPGECRYLLDVDQPESFSNQAARINSDDAISMVVIQHEFGLFNGHENDFQLFLNLLAKPVMIAFHTVLPRPDEAFKARVQQIAASSTSVIVMTHTSADILIVDYGVPEHKITLIPHGTHLVPHSDKVLLKKKYKLTGRKVLSTFGLLSSGKSIETTLDALPEIVRTNPDVLFLIIGKTHPTVVKNDGESYRQMLETRVASLKLEQHVKFINLFLPLPILLEYLQLTDIYLFTSKDPNQAVSGTFSYAISCGCPVVSTPIPHAKEVLNSESGISIDFGDSQQLASAVISLLKDESLRVRMGSHGLHKMASTAWENSSIAHAMLFEKIVPERILLNFNMPLVNLDHIKRLTTGLGMIQFSRINQPDIESGYTLDDNARALIVMLQHFELTAAVNDLKYIELYLNFIHHCLQPEGYFLNYADRDGRFTDQNNSTNLADSNGRAIWALGYLISKKDAMPGHITDRAQAIMQGALLNLNKIHSTRAMSFAIKGLYYLQSGKSSDHTLSLIRHLADRLVQMYRHESNGEWHWFEGYLTYANSILPEAMLCAWMASGEERYKEIALASFEFLLSKIFQENRIKVISNKGWMIRGAESITEVTGGEQPIDVAYTIVALDKFYSAFKDERYKQKMETAFDWFHGNNHLHQIMYNPCTGGCYDGLETDSVNLNQGAESTVSYLMAALTMKRSFRPELPVALHGFNKKQVRDAPAWSDTRPMHTAATMSAQIPPRLSSVNGPS